MCVALIVKVARASLGRSIYDVKATKTFSLESRIVAENSRASYIMYYTGRPERRDIRIVSRGKKCPARAGLDI